MAAKQSRHAHKVKVDQTEKHADLLEKKSKSLSEEITMIREESLMLKKFLEKYEPCYQPYSTWAFGDMLTHGGGQIDPPLLKARKINQTW